MTATQQRPPSTDGAKAGLAALGQLRPTRAQLRRSRARVGVAIALAVACGSLFALLYGSAGNRRPVLALARAVPAGSALSASDLRTVRAAPDAGLVPIPATEARAVVGRRAAVALVPGTLLTPADLANGPVVGAGRATVGLALKAGQIPSGLEPGQAVAVVLTGPPGQARGASPGGATVLVARATVLSLAPPTASSGDATAVTVAVPDAAAAEVATAAAAGEVALVGLGPSEGG